MAKKPKWVANSAHTSYATFRGLNGAMTNQSGLQVLSTLDVAFNVVFIAEALLRISAFGVWKNPTAYFRISWNWLDFIVTVVGVVCFSVVRTHVGHKEFTRYPRYLFIRRHSQEQFHSSLHPTRCR